MQKSELFEEMRVRYENDNEYLTEVKILELNENIIARMQEMNINRTELAKRLGYSKSFVSKLLNGNPNLTIKSMVSIAQSLECKLDIDLFPKEYEVERVYSITTKAIEIENIIETDHAAGEINYRSEINYKKEIKNADEEDYALAA